MYIAGVFSVVDLFIFSSYDSLFSVSCTHFRFFIHIL